MAQATAAQQAQQATAVQQAQQAAQQVAHTKASPAPERNIIRQAREYIEWVGVQPLQRRGELLHGIFAYLLKSEVQAVICHPKYVYFRRLVLLRIDEYRKLVKEISSPFKQLEEEMIEFIFSCDREYILLANQPQRRFSARMKNKIYENFEIEYKKGLAEAVY